MTFEQYSPYTSKQEQDESAERRSMRQPAYSEKGANAQDDGEQGKNDHNAIAVRCIVNADSGCLAYPSASAGYREDCAESEGEQAENAHGSIGDQCAAETNGGCLAYPSASAGYRENGASRPIEGTKVPIDAEHPKLSASSNGHIWRERNGRRRRSMPICTDSQVHSL